MVSVTIVPLDTYLPFLTVFRRLTRPFCDPGMVGIEGRCRAYGAFGEFLFSIR
jgi:hypothetical protein